MGYLKYAMIGTAIVFGAARGYFTTIDEEFLITRDKDQAYIEMRESGKRYPVGVYRGRPVILEKRLEDRPQATDRTDKDKEAREEREAREESEPIYHNHEYHNHDQRFGRPLVDKESLERLLGN